MSQKTHKGLAKRLKKTGTGKVMHRPPGSNHLMGKKSSRRARRLSRWKELSSSERKSLERQYGKI